MTCQSCMSANCESSGSEFCVRNQRDELHFALRRVREVLGAETDEEATVDFLAKTYADVRVMIDHARFERDRFERDEARAEVARARRDGAEAMREAAALATLDWEEAEPSEGYDQLRRRIRALPLPGDDK